MSVVSLHMNSIRALVRNDWTLAGRRFKAQAGAWWINRTGEKHYRLLNESQVKATRRSDRIFIFGSGYSINSITPEEWHHFEKHDTLGFNLFVHQRWVRMDYHLIREIGNRLASESPDGKPNPSIYMPEVQEITSLLRNNPFYQDTVSIVQGGWRAVGGNSVVGMKLLPPGSRIFRYRNCVHPRVDEPSRSFSEGLVHGPATLVDCVNFAYLLGWKTIVLVGVDLYDRRYFWLTADQTSEFDRRRRASHRDRHNIADTVTPVLGAWASWLRPEGVGLYVHNPLSLLSESLPVYKVTPRRRPSARPR